MSNPTKPMAGPIGWIFKILALIGKIAYWTIRLLMWVLRKLLPGR